MKLVNPYSGKLLNIVKLIVLATGLLFVVVEFKHNSFIHLFNTATFAFNWQLPQQLALCFAILLLPINIGLDTLKWHLLVAPVEKQPWQRSLQSICIGIMLGFAVSPVIGDLAAKSTSLISFNKTKAAVIAFIGNTAQLLVSLIVGGFSIIILFYYRHILSSQQSVFFLVVMAFITVILIAIYVNVNKLPFLGIPNKISAYFYFLQNYTKGFLGNQLALSATRYAVFASQFMLLSIAFQIQLPLHILAICIGVIFGIQSLLPNMILVEIGVRGAASLFIFGLFTSQPEAVLLTTYSLWFINRCIPGIAGWVFLARYKPVFS